MRVTETDIVTNHCLAEPLESSMTGESYRRFAKLTEMHSGFKTQEEGIQALKEASYEEETLWSVIYNKEELSSTIYFDRKWDEPLSFIIKDQYFPITSQQRTKKSLDTNDVIVVIFCVKASFLSGAL